MGQLFHLLFLLLLIGGWCNSIHAQELLHLKNPSFEDTARHSKVPSGWLDGGFPGESPPDIGPTRFFRADTKPSEGATHLVLITRDAGTWERVGNELSQPLRANQCYEWAIDLARSPIYLSRSRSSGLTINFNEPVVLRIWGGNKANEPQELLTISPAIEHEEWQRYTFNFRPNQEHPLLILEAMYRLGAPAPYAGNLLLDNASALTPISDCGLNQSALQAWGDSWKTDTSTRETTVFNPEEIQSSLEDMLAGRIDIGLYELATLCGKLNNSKLILVVQETPDIYPLLTVKLLRKRLRLMGLKGCLSVTGDKKKTGYSQLMTQSTNGELQVWENKE